MRIVAAALSLVVLITGSAHAQGKTDPALDKVAREFADAFNAKDAARVAALYTDDAVLMPPNLPAVRGRADIEAYYKAGFAQPMGRLMLQPVESSVAGSTAFEAGVANVIMGNASAGDVDKGKYVVIYKRAGNAWKIAYDIFNDDAPVHQPK